MPVPPPAAVKTPAMVLVKVMVFPAAVMVVEAVRPLYAVDDVAKVTAGPDWSCPTGPTEVTAEVRPWVRQVPAYDTQPLVRLRPLLKEEVAVPESRSAVALIPPPNVEVAVPDTVNTPVESEVEVALVLVLLIAVTFWSVVLPVATIFCAVSAPTVPDCANRLVEDALVAKVLVLVLLVIVAFVPRILVNSALVAERTDAKNEVEVLLLLVLLSSVMFWKVVEAVKTFCPEKVLLLARRVVDAPVGLPLQPNAPLLYVSAVAQVLSPAPKKLVV